jgi:hypothetical protein
MPGKLIRNSTNRTLTRNQSQRYLGKVIGTVSSGGSEGGGVTDHGALTGLADDDHTQYFNTTRGDARYSQLGHSHNDLYYTEAEVTTLLSGKSDTGHTHDDRYYTEAEITTLLAGKSDTTHTHAIADTTGLQAALDGKLATSNLSSQAEAEAGTDNTKWMSPLRVKQAIDVFAGSSGEANTASNIGTGGVGVFKDKSGVDLRFKKLNAYNGVSVTDDVGNNEVDFQLDINGLTTDATPDGSADYVPTYDASAPGPRKVLINNLPFYRSGGTDVAVADGGTGASDAAGARTNLGLVIGTDVQAYDATLAAVAALSASGFVTVGASGTASSSRTLTEGQGIDITNPTGAGGNPVFSLDVPSLTEDASPDATADYVLTYDTSASAHKKVTPRNIVPANYKKEQLQFTFDGGGSALATGAKKVYIRAPFDGTITGWTLLADQSGSVVIDVWKDTYANYPPTVADTITASAKPTISAATKATSTTLTGWTTSFSEGDVFEINVDSASTITRVVGYLHVTRT